MAPDRPSKTLPDAAPEATPDEMFGALYAELRRRAGVYMRGQHAAHTLQPTALVHEAFLKLYRSESAFWESPQHFMALAARTMMNILVDHARKRGRRKRTAAGARVPLESVLVHFESQAVDILDLRDKLDELAGMGSREQRSATVVELRSLGGLSMDEIAAYLGTPKRTIERDFAFARAWLHRALALPADR